MSVCLKINNAIEIVRFATTKEIFNVELSESKLIEFISHENYPCIGAIPSKMASNKDPVESLRSE